MTAKEYFNYIRKESKKYNDRNYMIEIDTISKQKKQLIIKEFRKWSDDIFIDIKLNIIDIKDYSTQIFIMCHSIENIKTY